MKKDDVAHVLAYMQAAFPAHKISPESVAVWAEHLARFEGRDAMVAAQVVVDHEPFFPPISAFVAATQAAARSRINEESYAVALEPAERDRVLSKEEQLANVAKVQSMLRGLLNSV